ncbi:MAG: hypothetical protein JWQ27_726 [Ferruginibacter sp.]|nr:hypothetical protein [Ferruginibacter sp.]
MYENFGKYLRLFGTIFLSFVGFLLAIVLLFLGIKLFFGLLTYVPWSVYVYMLFILTVPAALFINIYLVYFRRTKRHPSAPVRYISFALFIIALAAWVYFYIIDLKIFFTHSYQDIAKYNSYEMIFLAANVAMLFLIGIMQALTMEKEKDWLSRPHEDV